MNAPYDNRTENTRKRIMGNRKNYVVNRYYKSAEGNFYYYINSRGYLHVVKPCKIIEDGKISHYEIVDYLLKVDDTISETKCGGFYKTKEDCITAIESNLANEEKRKTITSGKYTFNIVKTIPDGYFIWNIGESMIDGYLPLCRLKAGNLQPFDDAREIDTDTLKAIETDEAQNILAAISGGEDNVIKMLKYINKYKKSKPGTYEYIKVKQMEKVLPIMLKIEGLITD